MPPCLRLIRTLQRHYTTAQRLRPEIIENLRQMALPKSRNPPIIFQLDSPEFRAIFTPELESLTAMFDKHKYELRIAGGAVRDLLAGIQPKDLDFATTATPEEMKKMFTEENVRLINMNGEKHGTITPRINDKANFEVTTLRIDVVTDGRRAEVQFTTDWLLDSLRRDLTINSMFLGLDGSVYDYFYGYEDLKNHKIRFVGDASTRICEDYLRILRYFRFYGRIAAVPDSHDPDNLNAIMANRAGLMQVSGERVWMETKKILEGNFANFLLKRMLDCELMPALGLPSSPNLEEFERVSERTKHLRLHPITLLASLLHNEEDAIALNNRLKLSVFERDLAVFVVQHRSPKPHPKPLMPYQQLVLKINNKFIFQYVTQVLKYLNSPLLEEFEKWQVPKFPVNGQMLKENGVEAGRKMGLVMTELRNYWADNEYRLTPDEILKEVPNVLQMLAERKRKMK